MKNKIAIIGATGADMAAVRAALSHREDVDLVSLPDDSEELKQATINVGTIGHIDHSKAWQAMALSGKAARNKSDRKRNRANRWR